MTQKTRRELIWAEEVLQVYECIGEDPTPDRLPTASARALYRWVKEDAKNEMKFFGDMVIKAGAMLEKLAPKDIMEEMVKIDVKTVSELQRHLDMAVAESQADPEEEEQLPETDKHADEILS